MSPVRVIDVPGLGDEAVIFDSSTGTILLIDPAMSHEDRMDCMEQIMEGTV